MQVLLSSNVLQFHHFVWHSLEFFIWGVIEVSQKHSSFSFSDSRAGAIAAFIVDAGLSLDFPEINFELSYAPMGVSPAKALKIQESLSTETLSTEVTVTICVSMHTLLDKGHRQQASPVSIDYLSIFLID